MTEGNTLIENSPEQNQSYWADTKKLLADDDARTKNYGIVEVLVKMTPELLKEDYDSYQEGFDLTLQALDLEDTETTLYYPIRVCAVSILANVLEHIQKNPKVEYSGIYAEAALAIRNKACDKHENTRVRIPAKEAIRKYLRGYKEPFLS
jgi:hypothetical protein